MNLYSAQAQKILVQCSIKVSNKQKGNL